MRNGSHSTFRVQASLEGHGGAEILPPNQMPNYVSLTFGEVGAERHRLPNGYFLGKFIEFLAEAGES